jgi:hypothetical protein
MDYWIAGFNSKRISLAIMISDFDLELGRNPEYRRILAELTPDDKIKILGLDFNLKHELEKKRESRRILANLSPSQKLSLLEELRIRAQLQRGSRRSVSPRSRLNNDTLIRNTQLNPSYETQGTNSSRTQLRPHRFGGRATAGGVNYESRIAAFIAVKMLSGNRSSVWEGINGAEISAIIMQAPEPVDDIVIYLRGEQEPCIFISAKERSETISLTPRSKLLQETLDAFVKQFQNLSSAVRVKSRLILAVPSSAGKRLTHTLLKILDAHRKEAVDAPLSEFIKRRTAGEKKVLSLFLAITKKSWKKIAGIIPADEELRGFLNQIYIEIYDFECGRRYEREAEDIIRSQIIEDSNQAQQVWEALENIFSKADQGGIRVTSTSLRRELGAKGLALQSPPNYAQDIKKLCQLTTRNLARLKEHSALPFGPKSGDVERINRSEELSALIEAANSGHLLITGEPGCGKSGLFYDFGQALQKQNRPFVLLLAEDEFPELTHALDEIFANWQGSVRGFFITDALDAARNPETQRRLRTRLRDVQEGESGWTVIASVREFDLKYGRELREAFPGTGVPGHSSNEFANVAHFLLQGFSEDEINILSTKRPGICPFVTNARKSAKPEGIHRSPFHLRLAAELLRDGIQPSRLGDWNSPAVLLRKYWDRRIHEDDSEHKLVTTLQKICRQMVDTRSMTVSSKEMSLDAMDRQAIDELRSRGLLRSPALKHATQVGRDEIRFTHHLLHDYAIARSLIPETPSTFCRFSTKEPLLPIFYRQSFLFALEEFWDAPGGQGGFWKAVLELEQKPRLHSVTRILGPILASRRVESIVNLQSLLSAMDSTNCTDSPSIKALRHLASGLQDADADAIRTGMDGWCAFAEQLANKLPAISYVEQPLALVVDRLNKMGGATEAVQRRALNAAGRGLLACHIAKEVSKGWSFATRVATESICRTFDEAPAESERSLLALFAPDRLACFPDEDLFSLSLNIKYLGPQGDSLVLHLFEAAFAKEPPPGERNLLGSAIMPLISQAGDMWNNIRYTLADYYETCPDTNPVLMTDAACIAWNAVVRRRSERRSEEECVFATIRFRGTTCKLIEDYSHIWCRDFEHDENRILLRFEKMLRMWAAAGDTDKLNTALDQFLIRNRTSLMWTVFMEASAEYPSTLGVMMEEVLKEPLLFIHADYSYSSTELLGALHRMGGQARREQLEQLILDLPQNTRLWENEDRQLVLRQIEYAQNKMLGAIEQTNIALETVRDLWNERQAAKVLTANCKPEGPRVIQRQFSDREAAELSGVNFDEPENEKLFHLRESLKPLLGRDNRTVNTEVVNLHWLEIPRCERALKKHREPCSEMAQELWGYLVGACAIIARHADWPSEDKRWQTVRRILLKAAADTKPDSTDSLDPKEDRWPSWGWPAPRLDAALGLLLFSYRVGYADKAVSSTLRRFCNDKSHPLRFNFAGELAALERSSPELMWEMIDNFIANEKRFSVLDVLALSMNHLWNSSEKVKPRLRLIADLTARNASADNHIHETLAGIYLFRYFLTGDDEFKSYIDALIADCDAPIANRALIAQLHECRSFLASIEMNSQAKLASDRSWEFFEQLLAAAQAKLEKLRELWPQSNEQESLDRTVKLVDSIASQIYFASGANEKKLNQKPFCTFWQAAAPLLNKLSQEIHPHTAYHIVRTLRHILPCSPCDVFLLATRCIRNSSEAGFQYESLAVGEVVALIQNAIADHPEIFQSKDGPSECLDQLLHTLDLFVEVGWAEARQLTHRLEEIYR